MKFLWFFFLLCLVNICASQTPDWVIGLSRGTCVEIQAKATKNENWHHIGTGWLFRDQTTIVTAEHVARNRAVMDDVAFYIKWNALRVKFQDGDLVNVQNIRDSENDDVAILIIQTPKHNHKDLILAKSNPVPGNSAIFSGYGEFYDRLLSIGYVSTFDNDPEWHNGFRIVLMSVALPGHSGSAVLNNKGEVIGMLVSVDHFHSEVSLMVPVKTLREELCKML